MQGKCCNNRGLGKLHKYRRRVFSKLCCHFIKNQQKYQIPLHQGRYALPMGYAFWRRSLSFEQELAVLLCILITVYRVTCLVANLYESERWFTLARTDGTVPGILSRSLHGSSLRSSPWLTTDSWCSTSPEHGGSLAMLYPP